jgi:APA family basic amino acid/polyamine antiporter
MSTAAEESTDSQKHMPKAIIYSLAISMVLYVLACLVLTGMVNYRDINGEAAFSSAFADVGLPLLGAIIAAGAILGILTVLFTFPAPPRPPRPSSGSWRAATSPASPTPTTAGAPWSS